VKETLQAVYAGRTRLGDHRDLFAKFREMNAQARRSTFTMTIPDLGLREGQAVALEVRAIDTNVEPPETTGGIANHHRHLSSACRRDNTQRAHQQRLDSKRRSLQSQVRTKMEAAVACGARLQKRRSDDRA
jgi:hypothetical protein